MTSRALINMQSKMKHLIRLLKRISWVAANIFVLFGVAVLIGQEYPVPGDVDVRVSRAIGDQVFDFPEWTGAALVEKAAQIAVPIQNYMTDAQRSQFVLDSMQMTGDWSQLEGQVRKIYSDAAIADPASASSDLRARRDALRAQIEQRRPTVEAIIQQQISSVLIDEGFGVGGEVVPPVAVRITPLPYVLVISPRDEIRRISGEGLQAGLSVDQAETIEANVLSTTNQSAIVVPIGGLADYPAMILETSQLVWLLQTSSHEWSHHWLFMRPLGYSYADRAPDIPTINETVASIFGDEVGLIVMRRYYLDVLKRDFPDLVEPKPLTIPEPEPASPPAPADSSQFNVNRTLHDTRVQVDKLLADARALEQQGKKTDAEAKIVEAEKYMEQQRQFINSHGYGIRKINQAYFAFYGAYADQPGAAGADPIGPNVIALRVYSPSLRTFMDRASGILSLDQLKRTVDELKPQP